MRKLGANHPTTALLFRNSNAVFTPLITHGGFAFFILAALFGAFSQGVIATLITSIVFLGIVMGPPFFALISLGSIGILMVVLPETSWWTPLCHNLFFPTLVLTGIRWLQTKGKIRYRFSLISAIRWLAAKAVSCALINSDDIFSLQGSNRLISRILRLVSWLLQGMLALSSLTVLLVAISQGFIPSLITAITILVILTEQPLQALFLLSWMGFLNIGYPGMLFWGLLLLLLMLIGLKKLFKWMQIEFTLLLMSKRLSTKVGNYASNWIHALFNAFLPRRNR